MKFSIIIPVFNRPDELSELLESLTRQTVGDFEVIVVEDGSTRPSLEVVNAYRRTLDPFYVSIPNGGPANARNIGVRHAVGDWLVFLDSDVILPEGYMAAISAYVEECRDAAFGGPDMAGDDFTPVQKAISYSMTSFFTTGGIRGGSRKVTRFFPRSFNMVIQREVFVMVGGFSRMRFGEDVDLSMRIYECGYGCSLCKGAAVYHKRRTDFVKFFRQVFHSGQARIDLSRRHPGSLKVIHLIPSLFTVGVAVLLLSALLLRSLWPLSPLGLYSLLLFGDAFLKTGRPGVAVLSAVAAFVQLTGYGTGFISACFRKGPGKIVPPQEFDNEKFYR